MKTMIGITILAALAGCHAESQSNPATPTAASVPGDTNNNPGIPNNGVAGGGTGATDTLGNPTGTANVNGTGGGMNTNSHMNGGNRTADGGH